MHQSYSWLRLRSWVSTLASAPLAASKEHCQGVIAAFWAAPKLLSCGRVTDHVIAIALEGCSARFLSIYQRQTEGKRTEWVSQKPVLLAIRGRFVEWWASRKLATTTTQKPSQNKVFLMH